MTRRPVGILLVTHVLIYFLHCNAFTLKCPDSSQWYLRSNSKCTDGAYLCLFDTKDSAYKEICGKGEEIAREGKIISFHLEITSIETCLKEEKCVICQNSISHEDTVVVLGEKGSQSVNKASKSRHDNVVTSAGQKLHQNCRKSYTNPKYIALANKEIKHETTNLPKLRSKVEFDFKKHCLFCGQLADAVIGRKRKSDVYPVRTSEFQCKIEDICKQREDEWALEVRGRLEFVQDLHAADALYQQTCSVNFRTLKQTPLAFSPIAKKAKTQARRKSSLSESFLFAAKYLQKK
ncbi:unnamed protein product [Mytilus coruscus]|uniref:Uncharacterized protein n=1 Tax=Mytilus coruscus TaxID=42192 RepID=A0A6J8F1F0_MYTCO|nr:unnamed protein product [Mytilus coruscus]